MYIFSKLNKVLLSLKNIVIIIIIIIITITIVIFPKAPLFCAANTFRVTYARSLWRHQSELTEKAWENAVQGLGNLSRKKTGACYEGYVRKVKRVAKISSKRNFIL